MTRDQYNKIVKRVGNTIDDIIYKEINDMFSLNGFNTVEEKSHFMSQICHESNNITRFIENLNYSIDGLLKTFPKYFDKNSAKIYARQPQKIANRVYANRMGNGDEKSGDGWKFRGASPIQLTGKSQFIECGKYLGIDLVNNPEFAQTPECGVQICLWYWTKNNLNKIISNLPKDINDDIILNNVKIVTKIVNGGLNGINERYMLYKFCKNILA